MTPCLVFGSLFLCGGLACGAGGEQALDVVSRMLAYDPLKRIKPLEVCSHEFVDEVNSCLGSCVLQDSCAVPVPRIYVDPVSR